MMSTLVEKRVNAGGHVVVMVSKMKDPTFKNEFKGWDILRSWPKGGPKTWQNRVLLWPEPQATTRATIENQREVFGTALNEITRQGHRTVVIDESLWMNDPKLVGLSTEIGAMHYFGRSAGITMVDLTQRPAWIPVIIYSSVTHAYVSKTLHREDHKRLAELGGIDGKEVAENLMRLPTRHDYVYLNPLGDASPVVVNTRK